MMERISSGVQGFDKLVEGGLIKDRFHLVTGEPGTGKSTFGIQYAMKAIQDGGKAAYISLEEPWEHMHENFSRYGFDIKSAIEDGKLLYKFANPFSLKRMVDVSEFQLSDEINQFQPDRIVFDSITTFNLEYQDTSSSRSGMKKLLDIIGKWSNGSSTFLFTAESHDEQARFGIEYIMDSVIRVYNIKQADSRVRALEVFKMRGTDHSKNLHMITLVTGAGMSVHDQTIMAKTREIEF